MQEHTLKFNLLSIAILTGFAFVIGGFFRTWLELYLIRTVTFTSIWLGFLLQSAFGMAVLAFLLRKNYPFSKLWLTGTGAFALGILFPALLMDQFFYALLFLPGLMVGMFFRLFLYEQSGRESLLFMITLGFLTCQIILTAFQFNIPGSVWLREHFGPSSVTIFFHMVMDVIVGFFVAPGVGLTLRRET